MYAQQSCTEDLPEKKGFQDEGSLMLNKVVTEN